KEKIMDRKETLPNTVRYFKESSVYDIKIDALGSKRIWFGTDAGLRIFDSSTHYWHYLGLESGLLSETVSSLAMDTSRIWIGTWNGLQLWDRNTQKLKPGIKGLPSHHIFSIAVIADTLWVATDDGVCLVHGDSVIRKLYEGDGPLSRETYCICRAGDMIFLGHDKGRISSYERRTGKWSSLQLERPLAGDAGKIPVKTIIWDIIENQGELWIATSDAGVWQYNLRNTGWRFHMPATGFPAKGAFKVLILNQDIFCGTFKGIARYSRKNDVWIMHHKVSSGKNDISITSMANQDDFIWYGSKGHGIGKFYWDEIHWVDYSAGITHDCIRNIHISGDSVWLAFGFAGKGADLLDRKDFTWISNFASHYDLCDQKISGINSDSRYVYLCSFSGCNLIGRNSHDWMCFNSENGLFGNEVLGVHRIRDTVWIAEYPGVSRINLNTRSGGLVKELSNLSISAFTGNGETLAMADFRQYLIIYNLRTGLKKKINFPIEQQVTGIVMDSQLVWIAFKNAHILSINKNNGEISELDAGKSSSKIISKLMNECNATCLALIGEQLWMGTGNHGILVYSKSSGEWKHLDFEQGLINDDVLCINQDKEYVWVGHSGGITRLDKRVLKNALFNRKGLK
ncbi:MAG: hypothetical protein ABIA63_15345, partial [bacterium]